MSADNSKQSTAKVVLITGAARRIGASIAHYFHAQGYHVIVHYQTSQAAAESLADTFNATRQDSCRLWQCDLATLDNVSALEEMLQQHWQRLDVLVHNASSFMRSPIGQVTSQDWDHLFNSNLKGAYFLTQAVLPWLQAREGAIVTITDIHASKPMRDYGVYCMTKSALTMMTQVLAKELAPTVRVNAIAPGVAALPEGDNSLDKDLQQNLLRRIPMQRFGEASDIAAAVWMLVEQCPYITGQVLAVDGGRSLNI